MQIQMKKHIKNIGVILFLIYMAFLVYFLFFAEEYSRNIVTEHYRYNYTPFEEIVRFWQYRHQLGMQAFTLNIIGNVVAFVPFGLFVPIISRGLRKTWKIIMLGALLSAVIEVVQLMTRVGTCDIDDVILNTIGAIVGYLIFYICSCVWRNTYGKKI